MMDDGDDLERSALSKASWRLLPLIGLGYGIAYMDRINISFAALQMNRDLHFSATVYGLGGGLFFLSYALFEVPSNLFLVRFGARRWIARIMVSWGVIACAMMFVKTPLAFYITRFLLGFAEAGFFPGVIYYLTQWFPAAHRSRAVSRFYIAWPLSAVVMGAIAGALLNLQGTLGLAGWQWLFLVEGLPAVAMSAAIIFLLPDGPDNAAWLSGAEKQWIRSRLASDAAALAPQRRHGIRAALTDPLVLKLSAINFLLLGSFYAFTLSAPALLNDATRLGATRVGFLISGASLLGAVAMLLNAWHSDRARERFLHVAIPLLLVAAAYAALSQAPTPAFAMAAYALSVASFMAVAATFWSIPGDVLHPRSTAVSVAAINAIGQVGSFLSPYVWGLARDATGSFHAGLIVLPLPFLIAAAIVLSIRRDANAQRVAGEAALGTVSP